MTKDFYLYFPDKGTEKESSWMMFPRPHCRNVTGQRFKIILTWFFYFLNVYMYVFFFYLYFPIIFETHVENVRIIVIIMSWCFCLSQNLIEFLKSCNFCTSQWLRIFPMVKYTVQWLRICLPVQGYGFHPSLGMIPHAAGHLSWGTTTTEAEL